MSLGATARESYVVKLLDVGLGRALFTEEDESKAAELTTVGSVIGKPDYTAPEQRAIRTLPTSVRTCTASVACSMSALAAACRLRTKAWLASS